MKRLLIIILLIILCISVANGATIQGPFETTEGCDTYEYYIGYVPPSPPTDEIPTLGGWIVTWIQIVQ